MLRRKKFQKTEILVNPGWPSGLALKAGEEYYLVKGDGVVYKFYSERVFDTWSLLPIEIAESALAGMQIKGTIGFRDGTLIDNMADGRLYLISANKRRQITNPVWLEKYGLLGMPIITASEKEVNIHDEGDKLD